jgi:folylpolyglutamate synthase
MLTHYTTRKLPPREIDHEVDNTGFLLSHRWPEIPNIKVGLFTSPHLLSVRERIRINNTPVSAALFTHYFFTVWDLLSSMEQKPGYFRFLTLLSFHVFLSEGVNAAIYECGIGGEYDGTNIIERPAVTGITSLGIDHVFTLGSTIEEIAWHKAGIMKRNVPAFTVEQEEGAMEVIKKRAKERQVSKLKIVKLDERLEVGVKIVPDADFQRGNASLALAVTETVLKQLQAKRHSNRPDLQWNDYIISQDGISQELKDGINNVVFRGRFEKIKKENITWYLDGAHTAESIKVATQWFKHEMFYAKDPADFINQMRKSTRVLLFNQQGDREAVDLLERLYRASQEGSGLDFDQVVFCPTKRKSSEASKKGKIS